MQARQFLTDDTGKRVRVVLDIATYEALSQVGAKDSQLLRELTKAPLEALASSQLTNSSQDQLYTLIEKKKIATLIPEETKQLEGLLAQIDQLALLKARALYTLQHLEALGHS